MRLPNRHSEIFHFWKEEIWKLRIEKLIPSEPYIPFNTLENLYTSPGNLYCKQKITVLDKMPEVQL